MVGGKRFGQHRIKRESQRNDKVQRDQKDHQSLNISVFADPLLDAWADHIFRDAHELAPVDASKTRIASCRQFDPQSALTRYA